MSMVGKTVMAADYRIRDMRDKYQSCGDKRLKDSYKQSLDKLKTMRGTVLEETENRFSKGYRVQWNDGSISECVRTFVQEPE